LVYLYNDALNLLLKLLQTQKLQRQRHFQDTKKSKQIIAKSCINSEHKTWKSKQNIKYAQDSILTKSNEKFLLLFIPSLRCSSKKLPYAHLPMNTFENIFRI
jgi:hypothetical protein